MGQLNSALSKEDLNTLIEAMDDWELFGNSEFHMMSAVKNAPLPPEDQEEQYEFVKRIKDHYKRREKEIKDTRAIRQEKAIFTKAKLMLIRQDIGIGKLFEPTTTTEGEVSSESPSKLALAEFFIKDMGVWQHYVKFLQGEGLPAPEEPLDKPQSGLSGSPSEDLEDDE